MAQPSKINSQGEPDADAREKASAIGGFLFGLLAGMILALILVSIDHRPFCS